jgi:hypothetical protein
VSEKKLECDNNGFARTGSVAIGADRISGKRSNLHDLFVLSTGLSSTLKNLKNHKHDLPNAAGGSRCERTVLDRDKSPS